jgi:IS5 family transposase
MRHELVQLAGSIDWAWIDSEIVPLYSDQGRSGIETRFVIGLLLLKHIYGLSDEGVCERWVHDPYFQYFIGEEFFQHEFPHECSDLSHGRKRLGDKLELLLAESLLLAHQNGALRTKDRARVTVDATVQPKNITFPIDAKLLHAAIKGLNRKARKHWVQLRQSYLRIAKQAAMMAGRYAHASSSTAIADRCVFCARGSAASSATSTARSPASRPWRGHSNGRLRAPARSARSSSASAAGSCIPSMLPRSNA